MPGVNTWCSLSPDERGAKGAIIAYVKSVPPVDNQVPEPATSRPLGRLMIALRLFGEMVPAQKVDHDAPFVEMPSPGSTAEYGQYLVSIAGCSLCHGDDLTGHQPGDPASPKAPNLAAGSDRSTWTEAQFINTLRVGNTPDGKVLDSEFMPWDEYGTMTDEELGAVWRYLESLP